MSGAAGYFQRRFEFWGFQGPHELFTLPKEMRNEFFDKGRDFVEGIFGKDAEGLQKLLSAVDQEGDLVQLKLLHLKIEDMTAETRSALIAIARGVKEKADADERRSLQIRLRKRLTGVRFYLEEHVSG